MLSFSVVSFAEETRLTGNVIAYVAFVTSKRGRVGGIRAREEGEEGMPARTLQVFSNRLLIDIQR